MQTDDIQPVLSGREILELQRIVREVPVSDHVIRYALSLVRQTRVGEPGVPDFVNDQIGWGAGPRAVQFLILGGKARALLRGRTHVSTDDIQALAKPVLRHRLVVNFAAESEGVTRRQDRRPADRQHSHQGRRADQRCPVPKDFCILRRSSGSRGWKSGPGTSSKGFFRGCTAVRTSGSRSSSCSIANTSPATTCGTSTGKSGPSRTGYYVKQFEEETNLRCTLLVDVSNSMEYGSGPLNKYEYACTVAARWPTWCCGSRTPSAAWRSTSGSASACPSAPSTTTFSASSIRWPSQEPRDKTDMYAILRQRGREPLRGAA